MYKTILIGSIGKFLLCGKDQKDGQWNNLVAQVEKDYQALINNNKRDL